ncbi:MAG: hypothetical protein GKR99_03730 [Rhodobacteraceae bacterium]|nr:hypothetical protein [Paracoccaceae bacterium]
MHPATSGLLLALATVPVIALTIGLVGIGPDVYGDVAQRLLGGGWPMLAVAVVHIGPLVTLVLYRQLQKMRRPTISPPRKQERPAVDSGPFGRLIE